MTQIPSRISSLEPILPKNLTERSYDIVFFGLFTRRRKILHKLSKIYLQSHPNRSNIFSANHNTAVMGNAYKEAKVCLVAHSYSDKAGGEYHRLSEFAPYGCIPVMERFSDVIGIDRYEQCGGVIFANLDILFEVARYVIDKIDERSQMSSYINWWKAGIRWEEILPTVYSE